MPAGDASVGGALRGPGVREVQVSRITGVTVPDDHQANPHVHLTVKAESKHGKRLNPRKADLRRWREVFAEQLRERGIDAEATRQVARGRDPNREELWQVKAREEG